MNRATIDASHLASGTNATTNLEARNPKLNQLFVTNYSALKDAAYSVYPNLLVFDAEKALHALSNSLHRYTGPAEEAPFLKWATRIVTKEAQRYEIMASILAEYHLVIHKAIHENRWTTAQNLSVTHDDIFWEVAYLIFQRAHSLNRKGTAKLSTRLYDLVKKHVFLYHNAYNKRHRERVVKSLQEKRSVLAEHLSDLEIAAMRAAPVYDSGYAECGLSEM